MSHNVSRRDLLSLLGTAALTAHPAAAAGSLPPGLGVLAERAGILFGASIAREALTDPAYGALYARETRIVTSDYALKFDYLRPDPGRAHFADADDLLAFARRHDLLFRGHALIWNEDRADWLRRLSAREIGRVLDEHIDEVAGRYAGKLHSWDVVNEPFWPGHGAPQGYRRGPWFDALGPAYVSRAFRRAAQADRSARLVLNEANAERGDELGLSVRAGLLRLVDELLDAGVPLHAVGLQGHLQPPSPADDDGYVRFLERLAQRPIDLYVTELDVDDLGLPDDIRARDEAVARRYGEFLTRVLSVPAVKVVATWQLADSYSWYRDPGIMRERKTLRAPRPLPFDATLQRKPAWHAVARAFRRGRA